MSLGVAFQPSPVRIEELIELAREAEGAGFEAAWTIEFELDSLAFGQAIAMRTERILTGSAIIRTYTRHPLSVAENTAVIDQLAPGRFAIGLGTGAARITRPGDVLHDWGVPGDRPATRMEEYIDVLRLALSGETVDYPGRFYEVTGVRIDPTPQTDVPIYLAAGGEALYRLCGRKADGMFTYFLTHELHRAATQTMRSAAASAGRDPTAIRVFRFVPTCVSDDRDHTRAAMRRHLLFPYLGLPYYQRLLATSGFEDVAQHVARRLDEGNVDAAAKAASDPVLDELTIAGEPDECRARLARWFEEGDDTPILYPFAANGDWRSTYAAAIRLFAPGGCP